MEFLSLSRGGTIKIGPPSLPFYESLCEELENAELSTIVCEMGSGPITVSKVFSRPRRRFGFHFSFFDGS
jgi:hypothetical protein